MKRSQAVKIILNEWALEYHTSRDLKCFQELIELHSSRFSDALVVLFGSRILQYKDVVDFETKYLTVMTQIEFHLYEIIMGEISMDTVILDSLLDK